MFGKTLIALALLASSAGATDLPLEPCVDGNVSASGRFPSQRLEDAASVNLNWRSYEPYYLFAVSASYLQSPFDPQLDSPLHAGSPTPASGPLP